MGTIRVTHLYLEILLDFSPLKQQTTNQTKLGEKITRKVPICSFIYCTRRPLNFDRVMGSWLSNFRKHLSFPFRLKFLQIMKNNFKISYIDIKI